MSADTAIAAPPREVELFVCTKCGLIGKHPNTGSIKGWCQGPMRDRHPKVRLETRLFREVVDD